MKKILLTAVCLCFVSAANSFAQTDTVSKPTDQFDVSSSSLYVPGYFSENSGVTPLMNTLFNLYPSAYNSEKNIFRLSPLDISNAYYTLYPNDKEKAANYSVKVLENQAVLTNIRNSIKHDVDISKMEKIVSQNDLSNIHTTIKVYSDFRSEIKEAIVSKYCPYERILATFICPETFTCKGQPVELSPEDKFYLCDDDIFLGSGVNGNQVKIYLKSYK